LNDKQERRPLLVVDGDYFVHRAYHALPKSISRSDGSSGGAIVGFTNTLLNLFQREQPYAVVVGWDTLEVPTYRHRLLPAYQSGRQFDPELLEQLRDLPQLVQACGFLSAKAPGFEADDLLATAVTRQERKGAPCCLASADRDMFQLASPLTTILQPAKGCEWFRIGPSEVQARYGVKPEQVPDFIALRGDPSDKIPGAKGIGAATAASLLRKYWTLEALLDAGRLREQSEDLRLYKRIATIDRRAPLKPIRTQKPTWSQGAEMTRQWGLNGLADRLEKMDDL
jgi:DNA polymerase-1